MSDNALLEPTAEALLLDRQHLPFELDDRIGVIVLGSDHSLEHEFRRLLDLPGVAFYESRIANSPDINPTTLKAMEAGLTDCAARILPGVDLDVVAYGCTSGAMVIGDEAVAARIHAARPEAAASNPMAAACAAFTALGCRRIALLTPYVAEINEAMRAHVMKQGFAVPVMGSFNEPNDNRVALISPQSLRRAALELGGHPEVDAVFVSCTSLRLLDVVADLEAELGKPVTSSNHALAWHCLRLAGIADEKPEFGRLFTTQLA